MSVTGAESKKEGDKECVNERERQTHRSDSKERGCDRVCVWERVKEALHETLNY